MCVNTNSFVPVIGGPSLQKDYMSSYKFIDLFAGIGGFHLAFHNLGAHCVFASEIDTYARKTYTENFFGKSPYIFKNGLFNDDITKIDAPESMIPDFDILCAGFPCQPFSQAGFKRGFQDQKDKRGNMFFFVSRIIAEKKPKAIFLENVSHLLNHDGGKTFAHIYDILNRQLGYSLCWKIIKASDYGLPQHRPRIFIVGFQKEYVAQKSFTFPEKTALKLTMSDVWNGECDRHIGYTVRVGGRGSGLRDRRNWDTYLVNGKERRLSSTEGKKMMGFPDDFIFPVSETQAMKQLGNSVAVWAVQKVAEEIIRTLHFSEQTYDGFLSYE